MNSKVLALAIIAIVWVPELACAQLDSQPSFQCKPFAKDDFEHFRAWTGDSRQGTRIEYAFLSGDASWAVLRLTKKKKTGKFPSTPFSPSFLELVDEIESRMVAVHLADGKPKQLVVTQDSNIDFTLKSNSLILGPQRIGIAIQRRKPVKPSRSRTTDFVEWTIGTNQVKSLGRVKGVPYAGRFFSVISYNAEKSARQISGEKIKRLVKALGQGKPKSNRAFGSSVRRNYLLPGSKSGSFLVCGSANDDIRLTAYEGEALETKIWAIGKKEILTACGSHRLNSAYLLAPAYRPTNGKLLPCLLRIGFDIDPQVFLVVFDIQLGKVSQVFPTKFNRPSRMPVLSPNGRYCAAFAEQDEPDSPFPREYLFIYDALKKTTRSKRYDNIGSLTDLAGITDKGNVLATFNTRELWRIYPAEGFRKEVLFQLLPGVDKRKSKQEQNSDRKRP